MKNLLPSCTFLTKCLEAKVYFPALLKWVIIANNIDYPLFNLLIGSEGMDRVEADIRYEVLGLCLNNLANCFGW